MTKKATADRRGQARIQPGERFKVHILVEGREEEGFLEDINNTGAFVATKLRVNTGTRIHLSLELPHQSEPSVLQAVVARQREEVHRADSNIPAGLGIKFVADTEEELDRVHKAVTTAVTLDLLGHKKRSPADTVAYGRPFYKPDSESK
jgi:hypothetical protein